METVYEHQYLFGFFLNGVIIHSKKFLCFSDEDFVGGGGGGGEISLSLEETK